MTSRRFLSGLGAALLALSGAVQAESPVNLLGVYDLALKNDAQIAAAQASLKASEEVVPQSRAALLPNISVTGNTYDNKSQQQVTNLSTGRRTSNWSSNSWTATLRQPLFNLESWFNFERADSLSDQARSQFSAEQQNLIMRVAEAYFNVLRAEDNFATAEAQEKAVKRQLDQTRQRFEVGLIAETDVHEARASYDASRVTRIQASNDVEVALEALLTITKQPIRVIAKLDKSMPVATPIPANMDNWVETAVAQNLSLAAARQAVTAAESQLRVSKSGHAPTLNAVASYSDTHDNSAAMGELNGKYDTTTYGLELNIPIFSGGATSSKVRESTYLFEQSQFEMDQKLRSVSSNARNYFRTINSDVERVDARCQAIISASSALRATESGYEVGTRNIVDVLTSQSNLFTAQSDYLNARYDFLINTLKLKQTAGTLSPEDLNLLNDWLTAKADDELVPVCKG